MEALKNIKMVEAARNESKDLLSKDSELKNYPLIREKISRHKETLHFE